MSQFEQAILFKQIVDQQSFAKAAESRGINASAASKQLAKLEQSLGTQLLQRTTRKLALTEAGEYFYEKVSKLQYEWFAAIEEAASIGKTATGALRIASPQPLLSRFLMPILAEFQQQYPGVSLELQHCVLEQLPLINADISISRELTHYDSHTMVMVPFYTYHNALFASPDYLSQHSPIKDLHQLQSHQCIAYQSQRKGVSVDWSFENGRVSLDKVLMVNSAEIMISAAKNAQGIIYLPEEILREELSQHQLVPVLPGVCSQVYKTCVYYPKAEFVPQKVRVLIDFLKHKYTGE